MLIKSKYKLFIYTFNQNLFMIKTCLYNKNIVFNSNIISLDKIARFIFSNLDSMNIKQIEDVLVDGRSNLLNKKFIVISNTIIIMCRYKI